jgi:hypothetical protein
MRFGKIICYILPALMACNKTSSSSNNNVEGIFVAGVGCNSWLIEQNNNLSWLPLNLDSFRIIPKSGDTVLFSYYIDDKANFCMEGKTIELTAIRNK